MKSLIFMAVIWVMLIAISYGASAQGLARTAGDCDLNFDRLPAVTVGDYNVFIAAFGKKEGEAGFDQHADRDNNGTVGANDWALMISECPLSNR